MQNRSLHPRPRCLVALLCAQLLFTACSATAHSPLPPSGWPEPKPSVLPMPMPMPQPLVRTVPNFQAPSAAHCARPVQTREVPGWPEGTAQNRLEMRDRMAKSAPYDSAVASGGLAPAAPAAAPSLRADAGGAAESMARRPYGPGFPLPQSPPQQPQQLPQQSSTVTAGMVDDNADFTSYLAFRNRTRVEHRARDIRERYLLEVKDGRGRGIADAEVAVQAASGHAMWARTDAGGRVWLHPNAFDPSRSSTYSIAVRKHGRQSGAQLIRGQKSAVEVQLDARAAESRARLDLVFLIDATGSMADEIGKLKATLQSIAAEMARLPSQPDLCFGLVAYRDKGDAFLLRSHDFTNDLGAFQGVLNNLQAGGGGDYPEAMNEALHETVHNLSWRG
ncbi:MAG: hypothetical protein ABI919_04800, partial [Ramlibacter sp.]